MPHDVWAESERRALRILRRGDRRARTDPSVPPSRASRDASLRARTPASSSASYVNWYVCNGAVLIPSFTDRKADADARALVRDLYPGRHVAQLRIDHDR